MAVTKQDQYLGNPNLKKGHTKSRFTKKQVEEVIKCLDDPKYFIRKYLKIVTIFRYFLIKYFGSSKQAITSSTCFFVNLDFVLPFFRFGLPRYWSTVLAAIVLSIHKYKHFLT